MSHLPTVVVLTADSDSVQRVVGIEIDGFRVPATTSVVVKDGINPPTEVTVTLIAGRVERKESEVNT